MNTNLSSAALEVMERSVRKAPTIAVAHSTFSEKYICSCMVVNVIDRKHTMRYIIYKV